MNKNDVIECTIESLAYGGRGVARVNGRVLFVERALPGQTVLAEITKLKKRFGEAAAVEVRTQSPDFVEPFCRHFGECGGCMHQDLSYEAQLREKQAQVEDAMRRIGRVEFARIDPIAPSPDTRRYRNKMEFAFSGRGRGLSLGLRERGGKRVVDVTSCHLVHEDVVSVLAESREFCRDTGVPAYDPRTRAGLWRHLVVRRSEATGELMVHLLTAPNVDGIEAAMGLGRYLTDELGIQRFVHSTRKSNAELAFGERVAGDIGGRTIEERIELDGDAVRYRLSPDAFFQPNTKAAGLLYAAARDFAGLAGTEKVLDLYCGAGGMGLAVASRAGSVVGIEVSEQAVADARANARLNGLENCTFEQADLERDVSAIAGCGAEVVLVDPPRGGMSEMVCDALARLAPARIVAVSCDPPALARDMDRLGYAPARLMAVDQFPHTPHVECVALLERK